MADSLIICLIHALEQLPVLLIPWQIVPIQELIEENPDPKALLIEGLKELGMSEDPSQVTVQLMSRNTSQDIAEYFQYTFNTVLGVNVEIDPVEWPVFQERNRGLDYEMGFKSYGADFDDPYSMMQLWMTGVKTVQRRI